MTSNETIPPAIAQLPAADRAHETMFALSVRRLRRSVNALIGFALVVTFLFIAVAGPWIAPQPYDKQDHRLEARRAAPSRDAWLGRDDLGRDIFSRILHGAHLTLGVGAATVAFGLLFGVPAGLVSGYFRGAIDGLFMRLTDILLAFPDILLAMALMAALGQSLRNAMIAVGLLFIPQFARVVRASALVESQRDYVSAARALGVGHTRILFLHILPNCLPPLIVVSTLGLGTAVLYTAALSFLGLGAQPPLPEWGAMLAEGRDGFLTAPHLVIYPGLAIVLSVLGVNLLGDGLRDALDVRL